jgi:PST family polysaccharide transporter
MSSLRKEAASGTKWVAVSQASRLAAQVLGMLILARLLSPSDFGVVAMASVFTGFASIFRDLGTGAAVIQRRELTAGLLDSVFWLNVAVGAGISILLAALAPAIAGAMHEAKVTEVLWLLALSFPIASLGLVPQALLERASRFRRIALIEFCAAFTGIVTAVVAAVAGWGVYSLVSQTVVAVTVATAGMWAASAWRPGRQFSFARIREVAAFSGNLVGFNTFNYFARNADTLLIGRFLGATDLGFYNVAYSLMMLPLRTISLAAGRALIPALSRIQDDRQRLMQGYVRAAAAVFLITAPMTLGLFALREPFVVAVLGSSWSTVSDLLFWLVPASLVQCVQATVWWLCVATGRTDVMFKWTVFASLAAICAFVVGLQWGVEGVAAAYSVTVLVLFVPAVGIPLRLIGVSLAGFTRRLAPSFVAACLMAIFVAAIAEESGAVAMPPWARLVLLAALGVFTYLVLSVFLQRPVLRDVTNALFSR